MGDAARSITAWRGEGYAIRLKVRKDGEPQRRLPLRRLKKIESYCCWLKRGFLNSLLGGEHAVKKEIVSTDINEEEIRSACDSILKSSDFLKAHRMQRLLRFLVEQALTGDRSSTSEYVIGIEVFDRKPADYVSEDPIVRVQVGRLRQRLTSYYMKRPTHDDVEISIPVGQYRPVFRRKAPPSSRTMRDHYLAIRPIQYIAGRGEGQAFANGLYEELLHQLFASFGNVCMPSEPPSAAVGGNGHAAGDTHQVKPRHSIEGSVRIDAERIRASMRLVDYSLQHITWVRHFDRPVQFGIREQEELAMSICDALKEVVPSECALADSEI